MKDLSQIVKEDPTRFTSFDKVKVHIQKTYRDCIFITEANVHIDHDYRVSLVSLGSCRATIWWSSRRRYQQQRSGVCIYIYEWIKEHKIFSLDNTDVIELFDVHPATQSAEDKYKKLLWDYDMEIGCYSSYTYDVTKTMSHNILENWEFLMK